MNGFCRTQAPILQNRKQNNDDVVFVTSIEGTNFLYNTLPFQYDLAKFIMSGQPGAKYCNELLYGHTCAGWFDIDSTETLETLGFSSEAEFIEKIREFLKESYEKYLGVQLKNKHMHFSCGTRKGKTSYHVIVHHPDYFWNVRTRVQLKAFVKQMANDSLEIHGFYTYVTKETEIYKTSIFDTQV